LALASHGQRVGPLHTPQADGCSCGRSDCSSVGKHPRTLNGVHDFTTDPGQIRKWARMFPDANWGIATGGGLVVLDVDPRHGGDLSIAELEEEHGEILTLTARTGGGGFHLYLSGDLPARGGFRPGLDLKAEGGLVVAPGSLHASGTRYEWLDPGEEPRVVPDWLRKIVEGDRKAGFPPQGALGSDVASPSYIRAAIKAECEEVASTPEGQRNEALNRAAFSLFRFVDAGADPAGIAQALTVAALHAGLGDREIKRTLASAYRGRREAA